MTAVYRLLRSLKEIARHLLHITGLQRRDLAHLRPHSRKERFARIYDGAVWQVGESHLPLSGRGSSLEATRAIREGLPALLSQLKTKTLLDVGCGDMTWMGTLNIPGYHGVDIVPEVIAKNQRTFPNLQFDCLDAVVDPLPSADTILCREVLFHLSFSDALSLLANIRRGPARWLIATTDSATLFNSDIATGDFRMLNLCQPPFRFPSPDRSIRDDGHTAGRYLAAWNVSTLNRFT